MLKREDRTSITLLTLVYPDTIGLSSTIIFSLSMQIPWY